MPSRNERRLVPMEARTPDELQEQARLQMRCRDILTPLMEALREVAPDGAEAFVGFVVPLPNGGGIPVIMTTDRTRVAPFLKLWAEQVAATPEGGTDG